MQPLQTVVLKDLKPGEIPIFIVAPNINDGDALANLLSFHLQPTQGSGNATNVISYNYFHNSANHRLLSRLADNDYKTNEDDVNTVKYIIDKDFTGGNIWGLQLNYEAFFSLNIAQAFPDSFFIFLYGTEINELSTRNTENNLLENIYKTYTTHADRSVILHTNDVIFAESLVLESLPIDINNFRVFYDYKNNLNTIRKGVIPYSNSKNEAVTRLLNSSNLLVKDKMWFQGNDVLVVIQTEFEEQKRVIDRVLQFVQSFLSSPIIYVITTDNSSAKLLSDAVREISDEINLNTIVVNNDYSECINKIIADTDCSHVIIDNLSYSYSISGMLSPFKREKSPTFVSSNLLANKQVNLTSHKLTLVDFITTRTFINNASFSKSAWHSLNGFDLDLNKEIALWDFCIRALLPPHSYCLEVAAQIISSSEYLTDINPTDVSNMGSIFSKHREVFATHLDDIIYLFSKNQLVSQNEIVRQYAKISGINAQLEKTKIDLSSLAEHGARMRNHINYIESDKLFRISKKIKHYKNIFVKDSKAGSSSIKKFLKFIIFSFSKAGLYIVRKVFKRILRHMYLIVEDRPVKLVFLDKSDGDRTLSYHDWVRAKLNPKLLKAQFNSEKHLLVRKPKISVIMPVYNPPLSFLHDAIKSVINQHYDNWELCISDDCSPNPQIKRLLNAYAMKDSRIKVKFREKNGHISANSNTALELATGEYVLLLDHDDALTENCMFEVVKHINAHPEDKLIYSDEDKIDGNNQHSSPFFKPDWSPDKFLAINYISHVVVIEKKLVDEVGGFRLGFEGSQDYDLLLRVTEKTKHIGHIPKILYNWRIHSLSVASEEGDAKPYAYIAAKKALEEALIRRNTPGEVHFQAIRGSYRIKYHIQSNGKVSILIPTKDGVQMLKNTIDSILNLTTYPNYEIIVLNNNSNTPEFFELMEYYNKNHSDVFKCIEASFPFNFSKLMNVGAANSTGEYILMLNNDVEIIHKDWISTMVSFAQHEQNGAIGVKLLYPDDTIQHAGTVIGLGDIRVAGHVFVGFYKDSPGYYNYLQSVDNTSAVTAACLMVRRSVFDEVGGMEEKLEVEYNDVDFCLRILDKGYNNLYVPDVVLYHYESATRGHPQQTKESYERHIREVKFFKDTWGKYIERDPYYNPNLSLDEGDYRMNLSLTEEEMSYNK